MHKIRAPPPSRVAVLGVKFVKFSDSDAQTLENVALGKSHAKFHDSFAAQKRTKHFTMLLQGGCSDKVENQEEQEART